jgi:hypothetical protein
MLDMTPAKTLLMIKIHAGKVNMFGFLLAKVVDKNQRKIITLLEMAIYDYNPI